MATYFSYSPKLLEAKNYRDFLAQAITERKARQSSFSYQTLVNRAGLRAKSFPLEVIQGKKRLSLSSARAFSHALNLNKNLEDFFLNLLFLENITERPVRSSEENIKLQLDKIKSRLKLKYFKTSNGRTSNFPAPLRFSEVYASMGTHQRGASREDILKRSALKPELVDSTLDWIVKNGFGEFDLEAQRYLPKLPALFFDKLGSDLFFKELFQLRLSEAQKISASDFNDVRRLFLSSVFSVQEQDLPKLTLELKEILNRYIDHSENPNGDRLARLSVALF